MKFKIKYEIIKGKKYPIDCWKCGQCGFNPIPCRIDICPGCKTDFGLGEYQEPDEKIKTEIVWKSRNIRIKNLDAFL